MDRDDLLAEQFEGNRAHLRAVAYRMLGSPSEADDAVQEAWLRLGRADTSGVRNLRAWLTTVVARVCLDLLRSRTARREDPVAELPEVSGPAVDPEQHAMLADSVGLALLVVLDTLAPAERLAFVLHDLFAVPFEEIAPIVDRSPAAARQLASRARRRVQAAAPGAEADTGRQRELVDAFLAASRNGDFEALLAVLDPDVVVRADATAVRYGSAAETRGAAAVGKVFLGRAQAARPALVDGRAGLAWVLKGRPAVVFDFTVVGDRIVGLSLLADAETLSTMDLQLLEE
jgi:RNA polymerase sigma factor (sigma-70 family)